MPRHFIDKQTITAGVMTGTNTLTGSVVAVQNIDELIYQAVITGSSGPVVGNLQLFGSNDGTTFTQIGSNVAVSGNGSFLIPNPTTAQGLNGYKWSRLDYVNTSGTGVLNAYFHGKGIS